jgi:uncharacterized protein (DUF1778 family)
VPQNVQDTLQQAADLLEATLNQFVVQAALREAQRVIERERVIHLSSNDAAFLLNLLEAPPVPNARLRKADWPRREIPELPRTPPPELPPGPASAREWRPEASCAEPRIHSGRWSIHGDRR